MKKYIKTRLFFALNIYRFKFPNDLVGDLFYSNDGLEQQKVVNLKYNNKISLVGLLHFRILL